MSLAAVPSICIADNQLKKVGASSIRVTLPKDHCVQVQVPAYSEMNKFS